MIQIEWWKPPRKFCPLQNLHIYQIHAKPETDPKTEFTVGEKGQPLCRNPTTVLFPIICWCFEKWPS